MKKEYLVSATEMKQLDNNTIIRTGIPSLVLMERAAFAIAMEVMEYLGKPQGKKVLVVSGNGNNGADGVCAGRILKEYGYSVDIYVVKSSHEYTEEMKVQLQTAAKYDIPLLTASELCPETYDVVIDAIFGIGLNREIKGEAKELIEKLNASQGYIVSADIPSGINASTGEICGTAIQADVTITFGFYKCGQIFYPGRLYCGELKKAHIAIDENSLYDMQPQRSAYFLEKEDEKIDYPRSPMGNKGTFGKVLVIAGRAQTAGAAILCASSALRSGCGMTAVITEQDNKEAFLLALPEAMLETYSCSDDKEIVAAKIEKWTQWADVVVIGCGLGLDERAYQILMDTIEYCQKPLVCDADALQLLAIHEDLAQQLKDTTGNRKRDVVLTPHPGELAALAHCQIADIKADRGVAEKISRDYGAIIIAKDADTMCVKNGETKYLNTTGNDGMATAGSGDVLAGLTASLIAQSNRIQMSIYEAVCLSVFIHGYAADVSAEKCGKRFLVASDIIEAYKYILK